MQELDLGRDRMRLANQSLFLRRRAAKQRRLEVENSLLLLGVDASAEEDEAVRFSQTGLERRPAAADDNLVAAVLDHLEVVREPDALFERGHGELRRTPEVVVCSRRFVVFLLKDALGMVT